VIENDKCQGLRAQVAPDVRVLVLGSMPGVASLEQQRYYAHPRNRFWPLMEALAGVPADLEPTSRVRALLAARIGLWDVVGSCTRRGSLDASIVRGSEVANPLPELLGTLPGLRLIACNGQTALSLFRRLVVPALPAYFPVPVVGLPSTSPANAAMSLPKLVEAWHPVGAALGPA